MTQRLKGIFVPARLKEALFQVALHILVFIFYSFDQHDREIEEHEVVFFLQYAGWAFIINYLLLPRFLYRNKPLSFFVTALLPLPERY